MDSAKIKASTHTIMEIERLFDVLCIDERQFPAVGVEMDAETAEDLHAYLRAEQSRRERRGSKP